MTTVGWATGFRLLAEEEMAFSGSLWPHPQCKSLQTWNRLLI